MKFDNSEPQLQSDVERIQKISIISTILNVICRTTNMGFAAVAKVSDDRWITCSVLDKINFGLQPGDELKVETTLCHEIRQHQQPVVIDNVSEDTTYCLHHTPAQYGFQSYISIPIIRKDGSFFGTLCAIDPKPAKLNTPEVIGMFNLFSDLISFHLNAIEQLELSESQLVQEREQRLEMIEQKNEELQKMNLELQSFTHIASHDLQEPLRKIQTFSNFILHNDLENLSSKGKSNFDRLIKSVKRMQTLVNDLVTYTRVEVSEQVFENLPLRKIVEQVKQDFQSELIEKDIEIKIGEMCNASVIPFQFNQLMQNIISNAIKFSNKEDKAIVNISGHIEKGDSSISEDISPNKNYCHVTISDNGIGFENQYATKIFGLFQRLHGRGEYDGTGIGLSIVKKIVDNHRGIIIATGELDKGAQFDIYLPQP
jgi:signal transduction histidine kinase